VLSGNLRETARKNKTTAPTVKRIIQKNKDKVLQCVTEKKKQVTKDNKEFFQELIEIRQKALKEFDLLLGYHLVEAHTLVTAVGVFTDKLGSNGEDKDQPKTVIIKFPGLKDEPDKNN